MIRVRTILLTGVATLLLGACGADTDTATAAADNSDQVAQKASDSSGALTKASSPFSISYTLVGSPIVGSPLTLNLEVASLFGPTPVEISYQITDATALILHEAQPESVSAEMTMNESSVQDRVTIIPQREGRVYLNVEAATSTPEGRISTTMAIPIHVGTVDTSLVEHGQLETDADGETTRVLTSE